MHHRGFEHAASFGGPIEKLRLFCLAVLETMASVFALINEVFVRTGFGRRYFTLLGVFITYYLTIATHYVASAVSYLTKNVGSLKPAVVVDPFSLKQSPQTSEVAAEEVTASTEAMFLMLKIFVVIALIQKLLTMWRKIMKREPELSVFGGSSVFGALLTFVPEKWVAHL